MAASERKRRAGISYGVVVDVGSGSVGVAIVESNQAAKLPRILYSHRQEIRIVENPTVEDKVRAMRHALFSATLELAENGLRKLHEKNNKAIIDKILAVCSAPWSKTLTQMVHYEHSKPFEVTHDRVEKLIARADATNLEKAEKSELLQELGMEIVEHAIVDVHLNGYPVEEPYGKEATEVDIAHLTGLAPSEVLDAIDDVERNILTGVDTHTHTYALVLFCVLRDLYPHTENALLVDISGEATEVAIVRDHILFETKSVAYGVNTILREIAKKCNTVVGEGKTLLLAYMEESLSVTRKTRIDAVITEYITQLENLLMDYSKIYVLPRNIFVTVDPDLEPLFIEIFKEVRKRVANTSIKSIVPINDSNASKLANFDEGAPLDSFLAISGRFFHKLHGCGEIDE